MNQDLTQQWLTEIQVIKEQMAQLQHERDTAWESAQKWRQLYNTEAEQRRTDTQLSQQTIASLKAELHKLQGFEIETLAAGTPVAIQQEIEQLKSVEDLQAKLIAAIKERDRLLQALKTEQDNHAQTRNSLTTALGDAIDSLTHERAGVGEQRSRGAEEQGEKSIQNSKFKIKELLPPLSQCPMPNAQFPMP